MAVHENRRMNVLLEPDTGITHSTGQVYRLSKKHFNNFPMVLVLFFDLFKAVCQCPILEHMSDKSDNSGNRRVVKTPTGRC